MKGCAFLMFALFGLTTCISTQKPIDTYQTNKRNFVESLESKTVALVNLNSTLDTTPYCTGVWIGKKEILTAEHCVDEITPKKGGIVFYQDINDFDKKIIKVAWIVKSNSIQDLALLEAINPPEHPITNLTKEVWDGQHVNIVGHTIGLWWSYIEGVVSSNRINSKEETKHVQISSPAWMGNSGGGAFDDEGNLIGICSFVMPEAPLMSFFVHRDSIKNFLKNN